MEGGGAVHGEAQAPPISRARWKPLLAIEISEDVIPNLIRVFGMKEERLKERIGWYLIYRQHLGFPFTLQPKEVFESTWSFVFAGNPPMNTKIFNTIISQR